MIVVTPAVVALVEAARHATRPRPEPARVIEGAVLFGIGAVTAFITFDRAPGFDRFLPSLVFPLLIWMALRVGSNTAVGAVAVFAGIALWFTRHDRGPLVDPALAPLDQAVQVYAFVSLLTLSVLVFAAALGEREEAAAQVRERERRYRALVETAHDATVTTNEQGHVIFANPALYRMLGHEPATMVGKPAMNLFDPGDHQQLREKLRAVAVGQAAARSGGTEVTALHRDGRRIPVEIAFGSWANGGQRFFTGIARDLSERRRAEAEREDLQKRLGQAERLESVGRLAGGIAHDFNNTLTVILGSADEAVAETTPGGSLHGYLVEIRKAAARSAELMRQLGFAGRQIATPKILDLNDRVADLVGILSRLIGEEIELVWRPSPGLWSVRIDPAQVDQIVTNLCINARDAITGRGTITVSTVNVHVGTEDVRADPRLVAGDYVVHSVVDSGSGMGQEALQHLFEPFFSTKSIGMGLGLATVHGIVEQNDGLIVVDSQPGSGTTFRVFLRRREGQVEPATRDVLLNPAEPGRHTIMVVEDESSILTLAQTILMRSGYITIVAATPEEAVQRAGSVDRIDLLTPTSSCRG